MNQTRTKSNFIMASSIILSTFLAIYIIAVIILYRCFHEQILLKIPYITLQNSVTVVFSIVMIYGFFVIVNTILIFTNSAIGIYIFVNTLSSILVLPFGILALILLIIGIKKNKKVKNQELKNDSESLYKPNKLAHVDESIGTAAFSPFVSTNINADTNIDPSFKKVNSDPDVLPEYLPNDIDGLISLKKSNYIDKDLKNNIENIVEKTIEKTLYSFLDSVKPKPKSKPRKKSKPKSKKTKNVKKVTKKSKSSNKKTSPKKVTKKPAVKKAVKKPVKKLKKSTKIKKPASVKARNAKLRKKI